MAASRVANGSNLAMVHLEKQVFTDVKRTSDASASRAHVKAFVSPSTLVWHDLGDRDRQTGPDGVRQRNRPPHKLPEFIGHVHSFALAQHCELPVVGLRCHEHVACSGARWRRCKQQLATSNCSSELQHFTVSVPPDRTER